MSADGRYVAFDSVASNLVPDDDNGVADIIVWDAATGTTTRVTAGNGASEWAAISTDGRGDASSSVPVLSGNGRSIAFESRASNLVDDGAEPTGVADVFLWTRDG